MKFCFIAWALFLGLLVFGKWLFVIMAVTVVSSVILGMMAYDDEEKKESEGTTVYEDL